MAGATKEIAMWARYTYEICAVGKGAMVGLLVLDSVGEDEDDAGQLNTHASTQRISRKLRITRLTVSVP